MLPGLFSFVAVAFGSASAQANLNGSFEAAPLGVVTDFGDGVNGWAFNVGSSVATAPQFEIVEGDAQDGSQSLAVSVSALGTDAWDIEATAFPVTVTPGTTYQYSVWARAATAGATVSFTVGNQSYEEYGRLGDQTILTTWQEYTFSFTVDDEETEIRSPIHFGYAGNVGNTVYIDGLRIVDPNAGEAAVVVEAESGVLGSEFVTATDAAGVTYIDITTDTNETTGSGTVPGANRTAAYEVTFGRPGWYDLYVRLYVGSGTFNDDSFFYADSFGVKQPDLADDWITANQLASAGYVSPDDFVTGLGAEGAEVWKWVNLSENDFNGVPADSFYVGPDNLTLTFEIGARENGLFIDKLAFGRSDLFFTVANLDNGEPGSVSMGDDQVELPDQILAYDLDKFLGNIYSNAQVENFEYYWNYVIPENAGKWGSVEGTRDQMNWAALDAAYALAQDNGIGFNFHVLTWGAQQPEWLSGLSDQEKVEEIREWFDAVAERYPEADVVQVANEVLPGHNPPDGQNGRAEYIQALGGAGSTGWDWLINAFQMARDAFPEGTRLMLNDYGILSSLSSAQQYRQVIDLLNARGLIDVIGVQGHAFSTRQGAPITQVLDLLGATGLPIQVTEMDIDGNPNNSAFVTDAQSDANQLRDLQRVFPLIWQHPSVEGVTMWGWRPGLWRNDQEAYLVQNNGTERPGLVWLREYLNGYRTDVAEPAVDGAVRLLGAAPNPFAGSTLVTYELREAAAVDLAVYDLLGRRVATLASGPEASGAHTVAFESRGLASGTYLLRLLAGGSATAVPLVIAR